MSDAWGEGLWGSLTPLLPSSEQLGCSSCLLQSPAGTNTITLENKRQPVSPAHQDPPDAVTPAHRRPNLVLRKQEGLLYTTKYQHETQKTIYSKETFLSFSLSKKRETSSHGAAPGTRTRAGTERPLTTGSPCPPAGSL